MSVFLLLVHGGLAVLALLSTGAEPAGRTRFLRGLGVTGAVFGLALFFGAPVLADEWRTVEITRSGARVAGIGIAAAWILAAVAEAIDGDGRWDVAAYTGVACTGLALFAVNEWVVPALIFAGIASLACALLIERGSFARLTLVVATTALGASFVWMLFEAVQWRLPAPITAPQLWAVIGASVAFAAVGILVAPSHRSALPAIPLSLGLSFALFQEVARGAGPIIGLVLLVVGLVTVVRVLMTRAVTHRLVLLWIVSITTALAALSSSPYVITRAAIAGVAGASAIALWPDALGRAQIERGILVALVAATAGFNAISAAATYAFERGTLIEDVIEASSWAAVAALLPIALAAGVVLGASIGRNPEPEDFAPAAVVATWALLLVSVIVGVFPFVAAAGGSTRPGVALYVVAVGAGVLATRYARGLGAATPAPAADSSFVISPSLDRWTGPVAIASLALGASAALTVIGLTVQGLRFGFL